MTISVIIPTFNEADNICETLASVMKLRGDFEIIVVDGGSRDGTAELAAQPGVRVLHGPRGRAAQMNVGASAAQSDTYLFLHADTHLPADTYQAVSDALAHPEISGGCFRIRFDLLHPVLRFSGFMSRFPFRFFHYGDATYFVRAEVFKRLNRFKLLPLMEDLDFWLRLTKRYKVRLLRSEVVTSARRFLRLGVVRQQSLAVLLVILYMLGVSPELLARIYYRKDKQTSGAPINGTTGNAAFANAVSRPEYEHLLFKTPSLLDRIRYPLGWLWRCVYSNIHMTKQTFNVLDFMYWHKVGAGLLPEGHPWITGLIPGTRETIWEKNIIFASKRKRSWHFSEPEDDGVIVRRVGRFLAQMVAKSNISEPEILQGKRRRMPHAVNYIHGSVHYNGGFLLFNDFHDAIYYLADRKFIKELRRFARIEKREHTIVLRERSYDPEEYAWFVSFLRARLLWYANANGPTKKRVLHGTPSPYPAVNPINGTWIEEIRNLRKCKLDKLVRVPIKCSDYFNGVYQGNQSEYTFLERFHAWGQHLVTTAKGFQGGLVFTRRKKIEPENWKIFQKTNGDWRPSYPVSHPFMRIDQARQRRKSRQVKIMRDGLTGEEAMISRNAKESSET
jgi:rSAM/selenodomain-associated transferase 2